MYMGDAAVSAERGIDAALAEFAAARWSALLRYGLLLTGNAADAEDLVQTALARTATRWRTMRGLERPEAYVRTAMVRLCANRWRSLLSRERLTSEVPDRAAVSDPIEDVADRDAMWAALRTLPPRQRAVVVLRYYEDMSEREIARLLGITQGTVKSQAAKALRALRTTLDLPEDPTGPPAAAPAVAASPARSTAVTGAGGAALGDRAATAAEPSHPARVGGRETAAGDRPHDPCPPAGDPGRPAASGATAPGADAESTPAIGRMP
jgi:RNA polymerase sigma-70 factor, ECF subfamily